MTRKQRRLILIGGSLGVLALAAALVLSALQGFHRVLQFADRRGREAGRAGHAASGSAGWSRPARVQRGDNLRCASR